MEPVVNLIRSFDSDQPHFRATEIYNENWLVKAVLNQASLSTPDEFPLSFAPQATWFSEAYLPTAFKARYHGDPLSEARTHADGVVGHFAVGKNAQSRPSHEEQRAIAEYLDRARSGITNGIVRAQKEIALMPRIPHAADCRRGHGQGRRARPRPPACRRSSTQLTNRSRMRTTPPRTVAEQEE